MEIKKDILWRVYLVYLLICVFAILIISKICIIQFAEGDYWKSKATALTTHEFNIEAVRGNIFDSDGSLLATSLPFYETEMDVNADYITDKMFNKNVDSLAICLSNLFHDKSVKEYERGLKKARANGDRYFLIKRNVSYEELQAMKKFPLFRLGKYKGGFIAMQTNKRERPFKVLAARTIGYQREGIKPIGLEGAFNDYLKGESGKRLMQKIAGGVWMPINDENEVEPRDGCDLVSTIDINIQDVAENSLMNCLRKHAADHGSLVLMEIKTGEVKAMANLTRDKKDTSNYSESFNYAVAGATVPGSTFKLASLVAAMEDFNLSLNESVDIGNGTCYYGVDKVSDSHHPEKSKLTVKEVFEQSSNVGVTKIITRYYAKDPQKYIDRLYKMNLNSPLNIPIPGEAIPYIKNTKDKTWSPISLPWISYGYETRITPLQILNFYSAVANNGKMMRPMFVKEIRRRGTTIKSFSPEIINPSICSKSTVEKAKSMMEGVVLNGTGKGLKGSGYQIAGKTGTAQIGMVNGKMTYQASFVGYFPADNPKYSCIVVISAPSGDVYYGGQVAGPVFKDVADKVYSGSLEIHKEINIPKSNYALRIPAIKKGEYSELARVLENLNMPAKGNVESDWAVPVYRDSTHFNLVPSNIDVNLKKGIMPDLVGMTAKDALFLLENNGLKVQMSGRGKIIKQSIEPGIKYTKGELVILDLAS